MSEKYFGVKFVNGIFKMKVKVCKSCCPSLVMHLCYIHLCTSTGGSYSIFNLQRLKLYFLIFTVIDN